MEPARKFKIIVNSKECGTCSGPTPCAVAKKVVKKLCGNSSKVVKFSLKECKRGCERVCGPYQGRMEKLDRPYKRDGKKITHRVVCGKVRKMRGGRELVADDFEKREDDPDIKIKEIGLRPHIFFGDNIEAANGNKYYNLVVFNIEHTGEHKTCKFQRLSHENNEIKIDDINEDSIINYNNKLYILLHSLIYNEKLTDYKTIRRRLFEILKNTNFNNKSLYEKLNIPSDLFERDYLPIVMTADKELVSSDFYMKLQKSITICKKPDEDSNINNKVAESEKSIRPKFLKRKVYSTIHETDEYYIFSKKKDSQYYNLAIICNDNIYIGICYPQKKIIQFYPIDENLFSRITYPFDFCDLVYLFYPHVYSCNSNIKLAIKLLKFYRRYISSTMPGFKNRKYFNIDISKRINKAEKILIGQ